MSRADAASKSDRALALSEKGITPEAIAERLGTTSRSVHVMIHAAKARRARKLRVPQMERAE